MIGRSRAEKKASAALRAQLSLKQAWERIDYDFDVVVPKLLEIRAAEEQGDVVVEAAPAPEIEAPADESGLTY